MRKIERERKKSAGDYISKPPGPERKIRETLKRAVGAVCS
jgi:hypothetical protein